LVYGAGVALARGVGLAQVVPPVTKTTVRVVRDYVETLSRFGDPGWQASAYGLEGFFAAKVLVEGLRRCGPTVDRERLSDALARLGQVDLGGFQLDYSAGSREGSRWVDIGIVGRDGKLLN
jgi:ABC-type branched-subunit amino acid transport system substrate-binding protein